MLIFIYPKLSISEPFVVLEYRGGMDKQNILSNNLFLMDLNYSTKHIVLKNETLSDIMLNYYGTGLFNNSIFKILTFLLSKINFWII